MRQPNQKSHLHFYLFLGRAALQKRIMALLRKIEHCVNGVQPVSLISLNNFENRLFKMNFSD